ncbi:serine/threonine-protein kinase [Rhodopirellula sp. MGV]|uniref:serine/threonine-protein kinase n=1 Tax=Rhodopirellula sp. MGV TaxID=2023130 RepID=UPI000B976F43|nr:serine/threonine-protein kinase [Rhodopirellula sp. MGV]OYP33046.1 protein kinase [Rhodopirellula sp. MGV]OYP39236.1 protein kinase [Rhodopirellula sp. MGV]PNY35581.1 serine/threonine protein kinase [Rhodopirellula baltica]
MTDAICRGEPVDFDTTCQQHPDLADELRKLWGAVLITDTAGVSSDELVPPKADGQPRYARLQLPTTIGDYQLLEEVGRGGMGVVFRARQLSLEREVAVKMILRGRLGSDADLQRFLAEAAATAKLEHPGIVPVYDVGDFEGRPFFSMKYIDGETLADRVSRAPLPQREAAELVSRIARAVQFAHDQGVVHRDLKPSNILLSKDSSVLVTDFGLAKEVRADVDLTRSGMLVGTPAYMSPEQAGGRRELLGPATDIYSLGAILFYTLTGRPPFVAETPVEMVMLVIEQDPSPPRALRPGLDRDLEMVVVRCLQKPVDLRYATAGDLADDLDAFLADEVVSARSGHFNQVVARIFRETHHAAVLENWGVLWMWHSLVLLVACYLTWQLEYLGVQSRVIYMGLWTIGLGAWAGVFWKLRQRMGPVTFIERQIAHVWGGSMIAIGCLFPIESLLGLPVLKLSPLLGVISGMVFVVKAGMLTGRFYLQAIALFTAAILMSLAPQWGHLLFGIIAALCFFVPGYHYYHRRKKNAPNLRTF